MQTDADAAYTFLSGTLMCDCGAANDCVDSDFIYCDCGTRYKRFKNIGWKCTKRSPAGWKARETRLLARIAELENLNAPTR